MKNLSELKDLVLMANKEYAIRSLRAKREIDADFSRIIPNNFGTELSKKEVKKQLKTAKQKILRQRNKEILQDIELDYFFEFGGRDEVMKRLEIPEPVILLSEPSHN